MNQKPLEITKGAEALCADRIGYAKLTKLAFDGMDLRPTLDRLLARLAQGDVSVGETFDLSILAQLVGEKQAGLEIQSEVLAFQRLFRSPCATETPRLRVLALAAAMDIGGNTPIEFLLEESDIELTTLYVVPGTLLAPLPEHDVAIVIASDSEECREALAEMARLAPRWPRPLLNAPRFVANLDRDKLYNLLDGIAGLDIPVTAVRTHAQLANVVRGEALFDDRRASFPFIVRPRGSHAGRGLAKIDDAAALNRYLAEHSQADFFASPFVDYAGADGQFRKYRVAFVDRKPYAVHMAIASRWDIWYLNAGMSFSADKRREEENFMRDFEAGFAAKHRAALAAIAERVGLDYFTIDCAENRDGELLIFEADNTAVVHNMDSPDVYPYKAPQMRLVFDAFARMLSRHARRAEERAA